MSVLINSEIQLGPELNKYEEAVLKKEKMFFNSL